MDTDARPVQTARFGQTVGTGVADPDAAYPD
jgi:hypothetical protein